MFKGSVLLIALLPLAAPALALPPLIDTRTESQAIVFATAQAGTVVSQTQHSRLPQQITTLLSTTGITPHLPDIHTMVQEARARHISRCGAEPSVSHKTQPYSAKNIHNRLIHRLSETLSPDKLDKVLRWYDSDTGKRVVLSEKRNRPAASFENVLLQNRQSPNWSERKSLIEEIELHTQTNRLGTIVGIETEHSGLMLSGCIETYRKLLANAAATNDLNYSAGNRTNRELAMAQIIRAEKPEFEKHQYQHTLDGLTFSLQDVTQSNLAEYAEFVASPAARHVFSTLVDAIEDTLQSTYLPHDARVNKGVPLDRTTQLEE